MNQIQYDKQSDSLYFFIKEGKEEYFEEMQPGISIEYDKDHKPIGIEVLNASKHIFPLMNDKNTFLKTSHS